LLKITKEKIFNNFEALVSAFGEFDKNVDMLTSTFNVTIFTSDKSVRITGEEKNVESAISALDTIEKISNKHPLDSHQISMIIDYAKTGQDININDLLGTVAVTSRGKVIRPKTFGQKKYVDSIKKNSIVFGVGPAGTGKTYLAVALAVVAMKNREIDKIILTRPAVEAGEKLGFLPGDLNEKVDPYLRPLNDALQEMLGDDSYIKHVERGSIEIAPLAYMRGRTLSNSFIILDEAQNTTKEQMKMFLTRMGENSHIVVTGDITQIDLPKNIKSGLIDAIDVLKNIDGIDVVRLNSSDVVRNELVARIVEAYDKAENFDDKLGDCHD